MLLCKMLLRRCCCSTAAPNHCADSPSRLHALHLSCAWRCMWVNWLTPAPAAACATARRQRTVPGGGTACTNAPLHQVGLLAAYSLLPGLECQLQLWQRQIRKLASCMLCCDLGLHLGTARLSPSNAAACWRQLAAPLQHPGSQLASSYALLLHLAQHHPRHLLHSLSASWPPKPWPLQRELQT